MKKQHRLVFYKFLYHTPLWKKCPTGKDLETLFIGYKELIIPYTKILDVKERIRKSLQG